MTISELITRLRKIMLVKENGKCRLLHVAKADKELVAQQGYPGLFDSADEVDRLPSSRKLAETIRTAKASARFDKQCKLVIKFYKDLTPSAYACKTARLWAERLP